MAIRGLPCLPVIILMAFFRIPEAFEGAHFSHHFISLTDKHFQQLIGLLFLLRLQVEYRGTVLWAQVRTLPVGLGRVMNFEEVLAERLKIGLAGIVKHLNRLRMTAPAAANLFIARRLHGTARIAAHHGEHPRLTPQELLHPPEATARKDRAANPPRPLRLKDQRDRVDAVASIERGEFLPRENVAQMRLAMRAENLDAPAIGIGLPPERSRDFSIESGPAAAGAKLIIRRIERRPAIPAGIEPQLKVLVIFP